MVEAGETVDLLIVPFHDYKSGERQGFRDRDTHLLEYLISQGRFRKVLIVDRPVSLVEMAARGGGWRVAAGRRMAGGLGWRLSMLVEGVFVIDVLQPALVGPLLLRRGWWGRAYASRRLARLVRNACTRIGLRDTVALLHHPFAIRLLDRVPYQRLVFDAMDNFGKIEHFGRVRTIVEGQYREILRKAHRILAVSSEAKRNVFADDAKVAVLPNGVDVELFETAGESLDSRSIKGKGGPIVGYVGTLAERVNVELLEQLAARCPDYRFVLVGPVVGRRLFRRLMRCPNVWLYGNVHYRNVPSILKAFDVCMLPLSVGRYENDGDYIKLYEYVAARRPVICTPVMGIERFAGAVRVASTVEEFARAMDDFRAGGFRVEYSRTLLEGASWRDRGREVLAAIREAAAS